VQTVPGPSPTRLVASSSYKVEQPFRLHFVPWATGAARSSSSKTGAGGGVDAEGATAALNEDAVGGVGAAGL
jgi:hypothetical protein